ncbi:MAG: PQQ-binding-like beta-propeller repeat protein [Anaerolineales bacterium]|nr:PQQ-binding-like beta-propeller repeat protein [Anaerolineales bacterium]
MKNRFTLILFVLLAALFLSSCVGGSATRGGTSWPGLAADADNVYIADGTYVYAATLADGKQLWKFPEKSSSSFFAPPVLTEDGQLLVGSEGNDHALYSIDPKTGKEKWPGPFSGAEDRWIASPLVFNDTIYAPNADGNLYILNMEGKLIEAVNLGGALWSAPVTDGKYIYITSLDHQFHAIDIASQKIVSTVELGGAIPGGPAVGTDGLYVGSFSKKLEVISNGDHRVLTETPNWIWSGPVLDGETLYYTDLDGNVYSFDIASEKQNWSVKLDGAIVASPLVVGDQVIVATEAGTVTSLDKDGKNVWDRAVGGKIYSNIVTSGELILVSPVSADINVAALDLNGKLVWSFTPEK